MEKIIEKIKQKANWLKAISLSANSYCYEEAELFVAAAERIKELEDALIKIKTIEDDWDNAIPECNVCYRVQEIAEQALKDT